jgi:hypothetical protein
MNTNVAEIALVEIRQRNFQKARAILQPAAESGDSGAQALLGQMFQAGWGSPPDYKQAFDWWSRAAVAGSADAQWGLGLLYNDGNGVQQDAQKAAEWWGKAAERGNIKATVNLAFLYEEGRGVPTNLVESARLFKQAAESGEPFAQIKYGLKLLTGDGTETNTAVGAAWVAVAVDAERIQNTAQEVRFRDQKEKVWAGLSPEERVLADKESAKIRDRINKNKTP